MGIVNFLAGRAPGHADNCGRTLDQILASDDDWLECTHDYIQWLFPLDEPSSANFHAPVLDRATTAQLRADGEAVAGLRRAFRRMLDFYGFEVAGERPLRLQASAATAQGRAPWQTPMNHNFLRITRILRALTLAGLHDEAHAFLQALQPLAANPDSCINPTALAYWRRAVETLAS